MDVSTPTVSQCCHVEATHNVGPAQWAGLGRRSSAVIGLDL